MNDTEDRDDRLPPGLLQKLRAWPALSEAPELEDRVVAALRRRRQLGRQPRGMPWQLAAAALILVAAGSFLAGRRSLEPADRSEDRQRFVLLLRESDRAPRSAAPASMVARYTRWATAQRAAGALELGEKLGAEGATRSEDWISGLFIVRARDREEAEQIARTSPHHERGQPIEVRAIDEGR
jgi:hypothetical protein